MPINPTLRTRLERQPYFRESELVQKSRKSPTASLLPFSHSTLWRWVQKRQFPAPVKLSEGITAWESQALLQWFEARATQEV